jgi:putative ABC transport system permease protein
MKFFYLVWRNLLRKKLRTFLTFGAIFVAFLLFGVLGAIKLALVGGVSLADANRLIVRHRVSIIQSLPFTYQARIARIAGVASVTHQSWFGGIYQDPKNFFPSIPVDPEAFLAMNPEFTLPEDAKQAWLKTRTGAIVGRTTADRFKWKVGDHIPLNSPIWPPKNGGAWEFEIVGIYDATKKTADTSGFYFRYDYFDEGRVYGEGLVGWFQVRVSDPKRAAEISKAIDDEFGNSPAETKAEPEGAFVQGFAAQVGNIGAIVTAILSAVFFTILLVVGNTMAQSVRERVEEIGVLKAMGFTSELVLGVVLAESLLIAGAGGCLGLGLALLLTAGGSPVPAMFPVFYIPLPHVAVGVALIIGLGLIAGIIPAMQAMRLRIAEALRRGG